MISTEVSYARAQEVQGRGGGEVRDHAKVGASDVRCANDVRCEVRGEAEGGPEPEPRTIRPDRVAMYLRDCTAR